MGVTTSASLAGGLAKTVKACDRCHKPAGLLLGQAGRMFCEPCGDADLAERVARLAAQEAELDVRVVEIKTAQDEARRAVRTGP